jgi:hypothetical protein
VALEPQVGLAVLAAQLASAELVVPVGLVCRPGKTAVLVKMAIVDPQDRPIRSAAMGRLEPMAPFMEFATPTAAASPTAFRLREKAMAG